MKRKSPFRHLASKGSCLKQAKLLLGIVVDVILDAGEVSHEVVTRDRTSC
jgi:hypothetical protein